MNHSSLLRRIGLVGVATATFSMMSFGMAANAQTLSPTVTPVTLSATQSAIAPNVTTVTPVSGTRSAHLSGAHVLIQQTATATGLSVKVIESALVGGQSLAQVATANKADVSTIVNAAVTDITDRVNAEVANGKLTQDKATKRLNGLAAQLTTVMNTPNLPLESHKKTAQVTPAATQTADNPILSKHEINRLTGVEANALIAQTASTTGLAAQTVTIDIQNGQTLAQIASTNKSDISMIVDAASTAVMKAVQHRVTKGKLTQQEVETVNAGLSSALTNLMNAPDPLQPATGKHKTSGETATPTPISEAAAS